MIHLHRVVHDLILLEIKYGAGGCRSAVKYLPSMHEALGLILTTANKQTNKQKTNCFKWGREGHGGDNVTNVQCKAIWKWHNESLCTMNTC
jgi:hypothetical protein